MLKLCASSGFATAPDGIIPKCLWDVPIAPPLAYYQADPAFVAGFIDGAYSTVGQLFSSAVSILDIATCYSPNVGTFNPSPKCIEIMTKTFETFDMIRELVTNKTVRDQAWVQIKRQAGLQAAKFTKILKAVDNISDQIKVIHHAIHGLGGKFVKTASRGVVDVVMKSGQKVFKCTNGVLSEIRWKTGNGWIESKVLYGVDYINSTGNKVKNGVLKLYKRTNCRLSADAADDACDWAVEAALREIRDIISGELQVGSYGDLGKGLVNLEKHHVPSNAYMSRLLQNATYSNHWSKGKWSYYKGNAITIEKTSGIPSSTTRHGRTATFRSNMDPITRQAYYDLSPSQALRFDIQNLVDIYKQDGVYNQSVMSKLRALIDNNQNQYPDIFNEKIVTIW